MTGSIKGGDSFASCNVKARGIASGSGTTSKTATFLSGGEEQYGGEAGQQDSLGQAQHGQERAVVHGLSGGRHEQQESD
jgi:hypothetical protein